MSDEGRCLIYQFPVTAPIATAKTGKPKFDRLDPGLKPLCALDAK